MVPLCTKCDVSGDEDYIDTMTLDECKSRCLGNPNCLAIDFGRGKEKEQYCYLNYDSTDFDGSSGYDAWKKSEVCGN